MAGMKEIVAAGHNIGELAYMVAVQNARVVSDDPNQMLSVIFNSMVYATSKAVAVSVSGSETLGPQEWMALVAKMNKEVMEAVKEVALRHAKDGFGIMVVG